MKNVIKKFITCFICCVLFGMSTSFQIPAEAKVIEPEIVKTETWTASYYTTNKDELFPYLEMTALIYNDGYISVYGRNTHLWDGFKTFNIHAKLPYTSPYFYDSEAASLKMNKHYIPSYSSTSYYYVEECDYTLWDSIDMSIVPKGYTYGGASSSTYNVPNHLKNIDRDWMSSYGEKYPYKSYDSKYIYDETVDFRSCNTLLVEMTQNSGFSDGFSPISPITEPVTFRLYGHDITITPELLSGDIVAEPVLTEQEKYILELEEQNKYLEEQLNNYKSFDVDNDDRITAVDAQVMLQYYVGSLASKYSGRVEDYGDYVNRSIRTDS